MKKIIAILLGISLLFVPAGNALANAESGYSLNGSYNPWPKPGIRPGSVTAEPEAISDLVVEAAAEPTAEPTAEPVPTESAVAETGTNGVPSLDAFASEVRALGVLGLWADGLFAFQAYGMGWEQVPNTRDTASYGTYQNYGAYFIHDYLGGYKLYSVKAGTHVAVIRSNSIDWFVINNGVAFMGTPNGQTCGYQEPYVFWGQDISTAAQFTALDIIQTYYSMPFAIQTCYCVNGQGGVFILTGVWDN